MPGIAACHIATFLDRLAASFRSLKPLPATAFASRPGEIASLPHIKGHWFIGVIDVIRGYK
jgi:hypothetical protein